MSGARELFLGCVTLSLVSLLSQVLEEDIQCVTTSLGFSEFFEHSGGSSLSEVSPDFFHVYPSSQVPSASPSFGELVKESLASTMEEGQTNIMNGFVVFREKHSCE